jgi:hypothetical protein
LSEGPPHSGSSEIWRKECEAIHHEVDRLVLSPWPRSHEENQIRKIQFAALIERRDEAARNFLAGSGYKAPQPKRVLQDLK